MADEKPAPSSPWAPVWFVGGIIFVLALLWYYNGGPARADLRGIFIHPPAPVGQGGSYGPQLGQEPTLQEQYSPYNGQGNQ